MIAVKGTPAYWKIFLLDVLAMVNQLGLPTFFLTLSGADLRWKESILIISRLNGVDLDENGEIDYFQKCEILNNNPVLVARHFQYRVETFFKEIIINKKSPLGSVENYAIKVEFQLRGSPHVHCFIWVKNAPLLTKETKEDFVKFIDSIVRADLPNKDIEPELHYLVSKYQTHCHSRSCRKYKNIPCRFRYGRFFTDRTICAEPLDDEIPENEKIAILSKRQAILKEVKLYIDEYLDPHKSSYRETSIAAILNVLGLTEDDYYWALSISQDSDFEMHIFGPPNFVNNYFTIGL